MASQSHFELILCDRHQFGYPWREVIGRLAAISPRSCILLVSPVNHDYLWRDVLQQGGYDVLTRPMREDAVLHAVDAAIRFLAPSAAAGQESFVQTDRNLRVISEDLRSGQSIRR